MPGENLPRGHRPLWIFGGVHVSLTDGRDHAVLVASEPLTDDPEWSAVEPNTLLLVTEDRAVTRRPMGSGA